MATNISVLRGGCPAPFFSAAEFPGTGGYIDGRLCQDLGALRCCLPCPLVDYVYPDNFQTVTTAANWVSVAGAVAAVFLLASWAFLPVEKTARHYLSISITITVVLTNLGFIIPLASQPQECFNEITPNNMASSRICAASGTFLLLGGWAGVMWTFIRALSLHLQICWQVTVGRTFMVAAHVIGWGFPVAGVLTALLLSGVSFRFGSTCHINHENSLEDFWIPLLIFSSATLILTVATFGYCVKVYLVSFFDNGSSTNRSGGLASGLPAHYPNSMRTMTPRQAYRRVKRVVQLQWRGITIVLIIITDIVFFSLVFVFQDNNMQSAREDSSKSREWVTCMIEADGDKNKCLDKASVMTVGPGTIAAVLYLLAFNGLWLIVLMGKKDMVSGWWELIMRVRKPTEFVSVDAKLKGKDQQRSYEMLSPLSAVKVADTPARISTSLPSSPTRSSRSPTFFKPTFDPMSPTLPIQMQLSPTLPPEMYMSPTPPLQTQLSPPNQHGRVAAAAAAAARYQPHARSFSAPRPPQSRDGSEVPSIRHARGPSASTVGSVSPISTLSGASRSPQNNSVTWEQRGPRIGPDGYFNQGPSFGPNQI